MRPGQAYVLTETGPAGYTLVSVNCTVELGAPAAATTITLNANEIGICVFTNDDQQGHLTLVKQVDNGTTGATATPADWTLAAAARRRSRARRARPTVTNAAVDAGTYTLSESGGPAGYTASAWSCTGATATGSHVAVRPAPT